ncbi:MAG: hypothetical protein ABSF98_16930 [Bryobacteraceae bacterium]
MSERIANVVLLVEDVRQENLLRRYLRRIGQENRNIRVEKPLAARGSGEQFVREQYGLQVRAIRARSTKACLIAMIDADTGSTDHRRQQLERALRDADEPPRAREEPILNLIPKRNVETWVLCLDSQRVDEVADYRHDPRVDPKAIQRAAATLFSWTRPNAQLPDACVPSLRDCLPEFLRIPD